MCELALPTHLNTELLENALLNAFGEKSVKVLNFQTKPAVASGDNYTSDVFRVLVDYQIKDSEPKQISLIVKYMLEIESVVESLNDYKLFVKEKDVFTNFLPKISALLHEDFGPKCHYITENPQIFVMEDLKDSGFKLLDRQAGLDLEHTKLVVDKLAKYHATSMFLAEQDPEAMELYDFGIINKNAKSGDVIPPHTVHGLASLIEVAATWPDFGDIVEKLKNIKENLAERTVRCIDQKSSFKVLNHGDLWTNNFMIKYDKDDKTPEDVYFVRYLLI